MKQEREIYIDDLSLKQLLREAEDFCYDNKFQYDERKIMITTDYSDHLILYYKDEDENN